MTTNTTFYNSRPKALPCNCKHEFQDKFYGVGKRLHVACKQGQSGIGWRCTVCKNEKST